MTKAEYVNAFKTKIGTGILVGLELDSEGLLAEIEGSRTYQAYRLAYKAVGANAAGQTATIGAAHRFCVFDEGLPGEVALPVESEFVNPIAQAPAGSALKSVSQIFRSQVLRERVLGAMLIAAKEIKFEEAGVEQHAARVALSGQILREPDRFINAFMFTLATDAAMQSTGVGATDANIQNLVNSWWTYVAQTQGLTV